MVIVLFLVGGLVYIVSVQSQRSPSSQSDSLADKCLLEKDKIISLVDQFESYQKMKDADSILKLFTQAQTENEKQEYVNLHGGPAGPRLYNNVSTNYQTLSYSITQGPNQYSEGGCVVNVEEQRSVYGGPADPGYAPPIDFDFKLVIVENKESWLIDRYESLDTQVKTGKYSGFTLEHVQSQ